MALGLLAAFWVVVGLFLLLAPGHLFRSDRPRTRRYGAAGCFIFALFCVVGLLAS
jgi:DMSO reductase anchor subunit